MTGGPQRIIHAEFYRSARGREPVRDFLLHQLGADERKLVAKDIRTVEYGWPLGMPVCRNLRNGLLEVRSDLGERICRILFCLDGGRMILLHGFIKKAQATPAVEMQTALRRKKEWETGQ